VTGVVSATLVLLPSFCSVSSVVGGSRTSKLAFFLIGSKEESPHTSNTKICCPLVIFGDKIDENNNHNSAKNIPDIL